MKFWMSNQYHNQVGMFKRWYPIKHPCTWESIFPMLLAWQVDEIIDRFEDSILNLLQSFEIHHGYLFFTLKCINYIPIFFSNFMNIVCTIDNWEKWGPAALLREQYSPGYLQEWLLQLEIAYFSLSPSSTILSQCLCLWILDKFWTEKYLISTYSKDVSWKKMALSHPKIPNRQIFKNRFHYIAKCT